MVNDNCAAFHTHTKKPKRKQHSGLSEVTNLKCGLRKNDCFSIQKSPALIYWCICILLFCQGTQEDILHGTSFFTSQQPCEVGWAETERLAQYLIFLQIRAFHHTTLYNANIVTKAELLVVPGPMEGWERRNKGAGKDNWVDIIRRHQPRRRGGNSTSCLTASWCQLS